MIGVLLRLVYVFLGMSLKGVFDYIASSHSKSLADLEKRKESLATYRPVPAIIKGSAEEASFMARQHHQNAVAPELKKLSAEIEKVRKRPLYFWSALSFVFAAAAAVLQWLELNGYK